MFISYKSIYPFLLYYYNKKRKARNLHRTSCDFLHKTEANLSFFLSSAIELPPPSSPSIETGNPMIKFRKNQLTIPLYCYIIVLVD